MIFDRKLAAALFVLVFVAPVVTEAATTAFVVVPEESRKLAPHRALYDIELAAVKSGTQIINISGQMLYEWEKSCDGWLSTHRFNLLYEYADNEPMQIASDFKTFESFDGKTLDFDSKRKRNGRLFEEFSGNAGLDAEGKGKAVFSMPEGLEYSLRSGSLFPMGHTVRILNAIDSKEKFFTTTLFDGAG